MATGVTWQQSAVNFELCHRLPPTVVQSGLHTETECGNLLGSAMMLQITAKCHIATKECQMPQFCVTSDEKQTSINILVLRKSISNIHRHKLEYHSFANYDKVVGNSHILQVSIQSVTLLNVKT